EVISDTHSLFSFQRSSSLSAAIISSPATLIIYHVAPINASFIFKRLFPVNSYSAYRLNNAFL
ncbi:hypothetical protein, partial [Paenibacillus piscarius]|uniref:hypothetical protein n=1 Tax=Paenibacillus piscarius TaxID=1089681 RepID=UPI001EE9133A